MFFENVLKERDSNILHLEKQSANYRLQLEELTQEFETTLSEHENLMQDKKILMKEVSQLRDLKSQANRKMEDSIYQVNEQQEAFELLQLERDEFSRRLGEMQVQMAEDNNRIRELEESSSGSQNDLIQ